MMAQHGPDYDYTLDKTVDTHPFLNRIMWQNETYSFSASYEFINNAYIFAELISSTISGDPEYVKKYTPEFFRGKLNTLSAGFNIGF